MKTETKVNSHWKTIWTLRDSKGLPTLQKVLATWAPGHLQHVSQLISHIVSS